MSSLLMRSKTLLYLALLASSLPAATLCAQPLQEDGEGRVFLNAGAFEDGGLVDLSTVPWRFREGDDPAWADPAYDDGAWGLMDTDFLPDSAYTDVWQGLGWFRLHLRVDPTLHGTILAVSMYHLGASEIYLDGAYAGGFGVIGSSAAADRPYTPKGLPVALSFDDRDEHVLAVRYANRSVSAKAIALFRENPYLPAGFALVLGPNRNLVNSYVNGVRSFWTEGMILGVHALLALLFLVLFFFDRRDVANLFFSLACAGLAVGITFASGIQRRELIFDGYTDLVLLDYVSNVCVLVFVQFLLLTFYAIFARQWMRNVWGFGALWIVVLLASLRAPSISSSSVFLLLVLLVVLEAFRVTAYALYKRKDGALILGTGVLIFLGVNVFALATGSFDSTRTIGRLFLWEVPRLIYPQFYDIVLFVLPIPIAMSVLLARRFVGRSRRLERELERVEELSERTLAQEREKQALIAGQNERLEAEVDARTAELKQSLADLKAAQAQLVQQEKMASLGQLTAGIAHEIKNPLNFINNFAEVNQELADELRQDLASHPDALAAVEDLLADLRQNATVINQHGRRADSIVHAMMQHASGGTGRREATDVNALVAEQIDLAYHGKRARMPGLVVEITRDLGPDVGEVALVPQDIGRVVLNLLSNAFDAVHERAAADEGTYTPTVAVSTRRAAGWVEVRVSDNGMGVPREARDKIFEPFFTTKPTGSGTGLGLSLSHDIVVQGHGGTMEVEGEAGRGATFIVRLPVHPAQDGTTA